MDVEAGVLPGEDPLRPFGAEKLLADKIVLNLPGKSVTRVDAVKIALYDLLDDRPKEAGLLLDAFIIVRQEAIEIMEQNPVEESCQLSLAAKAGPNQSFSKFVARAGRNLFCGKRKVLISQGLSSKLIGDL